MGIHRDFRPPNNIAVIAYSPHFVFLQQKFNIYTRKIEENDYLEKENNRLNNFLERTYEYVSILFNFPKDRLKRFVKDFVDKMKGN